MRQMPNFRYTPRGRPHSPHRLSRRVVNFGTRSAFAIFDLLATGQPILRQWNVKADLTAANRFG
jgi:hypothetical protein